jgi:hypothetical protein
MNEEEVQDAALHALQLRPEDPSESNRLRLALSDLRHRERPH